MAGTNYYQVKIRKKAEQQSLAKYGLDFVTDIYLPEKLAELDWLDKKQLAYTCPICQNNHLPGRIKLPRY